jgi:hypothetical protein
MADTGNNYRYRVLNNFIYDAIATVPVTVQAAAGLGSFQ